MLTAEQVTALTAQAAAAATYDAYDADGNLLPDWQLDSNGNPIYLGSEISVRGIGIYGQTPAGLVSAGYLKPGTLSLITSADLTITVLNTPAVWTGKQGIGSLFDYLDEPVLQNIAQYEIMKGAYQGLVDVGILVGNETARYQATFLQPATRYGIDAVLSWVENRASNELVNLLKISARQGQYAIDFIDTFLEDINLGINLPGFSNTVLRDDVDLAVTEIIGNEKVPNLEFADPAITSVQAPVENDESGRFRFAQRQQPE
jgi:hypothetical protein